MEEALHNCPYPGSSPACAGTAACQREHYSSIPPPAGKHKLADYILALVNALLSDKGLLLKAGMVVDATLIAALSSTKNQGGT